jgi:malonyl-CoA O-methyltransferase
MATTGPDTHRELHRALAENSDAIAGGNVIHAMRLGDLLVRTGFREPVVDSDWLTTTHPDLDSLLEDLRHTGTTCLPDIDPIPPGDGTSGHLPGDGDRYSLTWEIVYASAWAPEEGQPIRTDLGEAASISAIEHSRSTPLARPFGLLKSAAIMVFLAAGIDTMD